MERDIQAFRGLFQTYSSALSGDVSKYASRQSRLVLPRPDPSLLARLFRHVHGLFQAEPILLSIHSPCIIIGDIHGQILDLYRILNTLGNPGSRTYLFLGDLVDRGEFSIEALIVVFLLKAIWPEQVFLIRGNHEFGSLCSQCGFMSQVVSFYGSANVYNDAVQVFPDIPMAARIDEDILCVHGGIGPRLFNLQTIASIQRPILDFGDDIIDSLVWSDPSSTVSEFEESAARGAGYLFGEAALTLFLDQSRLSLLVRAHECVAEGAQTLFGGCCMTVFSASNYCGLMGNEGAVLEVIAPGERRVRTFPPLQWLLRSAVQFPGPSCEVREPKEPRELGNYARRSLPSPKPGLGRRMSVSLMPKLGGGDSLGSLPKFDAFAPIIPPDSPIMTSPPPQVKVLKPAAGPGRGRGGRRLSMAV